MKKLFKIMWTHASASVLEGVAGNGLTIHEQ